MIDSTIELITPWKAEQRFYDEEGKLVEVRTLMSSRAGSINEFIGRGIIRLNHNWAAWARSDDMGEQSIHRIIEDRGAT